MAITSVRSIILKAGGPARLSRESGGRPSAWAVYKWMRNGIPQRHWPLVIRLAGVTADDLLNANQVLLAGIAPATEEAA